MEQRAGNILGELTAETDKTMLDLAFYESRNYRELIHGTDFRFVVGRRGTGKSALFEKVKEALAHQPGILLLTERPTEDKASAFQHELRKLSSDYASVRMICRLTWKIQILTEALEAILDQYKASRLDHFQTLIEYRDTQKSLFSERGLARSLEALRSALAHYPIEDAVVMPERIATHFRVNWLQAEVFSALRELKRKVVFLYDGLDEGWVPSSWATGLLGGLAKATVEFKEGSGVHCLLFIRDNMFRALAEFDGDYTRNIEGNTLRLHWDEDSLLDLVALRLRAAFGWRGENNIRVWNRFAQRGLEGIDGFRRCLRLTLYRPRDVIALINGAYQIAASHNRAAIIDSDVDVTATRISEARLRDLYKEYDQVFPGLSQFAQVVQGDAPRLRYETIHVLLQTVAARPHEGLVERDFALINTGAEAFNALYSVGFVGIQDPDGTVRFCHDGSNTDIQGYITDRTVVVHPCYWRALGLNDDHAEDISIRVDDEEDVTLGRAGKTEMVEMRLRQLGRIIEELHRIPTGQAGGHAFEEWTLSASKYLFSLGLDNISWRQNLGQSHRRDIAGVVKGQSSFWKKLQNYDVQQVLILAENEEETTEDVFRHAWNCLKPPFGRCLIVVTRSREEKISESERSLVKRGYDGQPRRLIVLVPAMLLERALRKMRGSNEKRDDYTVDLLNKRLEVFERSYVTQRARDR